MLKHIVLFKFKADVEPTAIDQVNQAFGRLTEDIPGVLDICMGTDNSPEKIARGYTHGYILTMEDANARDRYLNDPVHKAFQRLVDPLLEEVLVFDFDC